MNSREKFDRWLEKRHLIADPFSTYIAEDEEELLPLVWVERPHLMSIIGDPQFPRPTFLLAGRGEGKTATRAMVEYECKKSLRGKVLAVPYFEHSLLLEQAGGKATNITLRMHISMMVRAILKNLAVNVPVVCFERINENDRNSLSAYVETFADPFTKPVLEQIIRGKPVPVSWGELSPYEVLQTLVSIITRLPPFPNKEKPLQSIFILFDRMDETPARMDGALDILRPIICDGPLLETPHVSLKFFLPLALGDRLLQDLPIRRDRVVIERIEWNREALNEMVEQRLRNFSEDYVESLADLCQENARVRGMELLLNACEGSPRTLLQLCSQVLHRHALTSFDPQIGLETIHDVISDYRHEREAERAREMTQVAEPAVEEPPVQEIPSRGLFMDGSGHVWVDGQTVQPLSEKENTLLWALYRAAPKILNHDTLTEIVWQSNEEGKDDQNLRKLIARLRKKLQPESTGTDERFLKNIKGRGYWLSKE